jgi:hypothetical protein
VSSAGFLLCFFFGISASLGLDAQGHFEKEALDALGFFLVEDLDAGIGEKEGRSGKLSDPVNLLSMLKPHLCQQGTMWQWWPVHQQNSM